MKKLIIGISAFLLVILFAGGAFAKTDSLPAPGILPGSPFYFLKSLSENIGTFFTFGDGNKANRYADLAETRLAEAKALIEDGKLDIAENAIGKYKEHLDLALAKAEEGKANGLDTDEVLAKVYEATLKHQAVLAEVYEKVPDQAKPAIERAMEAGMRGHEEAIKAVSGEKRQEVVDKVEEKRQQVEQKLDELRGRGRQIPIPNIPKNDNEESEDEESALPGGKSINKPEDTNTEETVVPERANSEEQRGR